ncbi:Asp-tRNA(Asn)/Glu-tRNA(Gln) amidotransferase subunit GatB [Planctomicrobium sp. SH661]|uniref:Asp-tRNA(Asn)/Glu-tRNA(Gln) amidotransferase subunit GatB n=1 Tax=Planctomicrobium sp. SH661 TaxID=3448124 RepID=UPI003F5C9DCB
MQYTTVVGLEVHVQLQTKTKIFCGCLNRFNPDAPNTQTCPVCLGLPGALPVMNQEAFRLSLITALALNCEIAPFTKWDRKQYYYPDLPKGYQISQYDLPFSHDGYLEATRADGTTSQVRILRAHLEEDAGKNIHDESGRGADSQVDLNRAGTPLLEIVTQPDIRSAAEAKSFLEEMHLLLTFLGVSDCNMQEGSMRCDANVNLHIDMGEKIATPIVEIKNLNTFRGVEAAIEYEVQRQLKEFTATGKKLGDPGVEKETRGWDANRNLTFAQRGKEAAADYRYFPDPDLLPVTVSRETIEEIRSSLKESPARRRNRFQQELGLSPYDANVLVNQGSAVADYYEQVFALCGDAKQAANWVTQDVLRELNDRRLSVDEFPISSDVLGTLLKRVTDKVLTVKSAREVFSLLLPPERDDEEGESCEEYTVPVVSDIDRLIAERGLAVVNDTGALEAAITAAMAENARAIEDFRAGKQQALGAIIGKVMKQVKGADPKLVRELIFAKLS